MRKTKFWLIQIVMLVMLSLVFGSAAFAGPPDGKGKGTEMSIKALTNHAGDHSKGMEYASDNAAFMGGSTSDDGSGDGDSGDTGDTGDESCVSGTWLFDSAGNFIGICP
jgi:hypothetical protein